MATLTKSMLEDLHKGIAAISLLPYAEGGVDFSTALNFQEADQIFTIKDSFNLTPSDPTIDQRDETIDTEVETGEYTMEGQIPSVASAVLDYFMEKGVAVTSIKGQEGDSYSGNAYYNKSKEVIATVLIESASKKTAIVFARVKFVVNGVSQEGNSMAYCAFTGSILANTKAGQGDFAVLKSIA